MYNVITNITILRNINFTCCTIEHILRNYIHVYINFHEKIKFLNINKFQTFSYSDNFDFFTISHKVKSTFITQYLFF